MLISNQYLSELIIYKRKFIFIFLSLIFLLSFNMSFLEPGRDIDDKLMFLLQKDNILNSDKIEKIKKNEKYLLESCEKDFICEKDYIEKINYLNAQKTTGIISLIIEKILNNINIDEYKKISINYYYTLLILNFIPFIFIFFLLNNKKINDYEKIIFLSLISIPFYFILLNSILGLKIFHFYSDMPWQYAPRTSAQIFSITSICLIFFKKIRLSFITSFIALITHSGIGFCISSIMLVISFYYYLKDKKFIYNFLLFSLLFLISLFFLKNYIPTLFLSENNYFNFNKQKYFNLNWLILFSILPFYVKKKFLENKQIMSIFQRDILFILEVLFIFIITTKLIFFSDYYDGFSKIVFKFNGILLPVLTAIYAKNIINFIPENYFQIIQDKLKIIITLTLLVLSVLIYYRLPITINNFLNMPAELNKVNDFSKKQIPNYILSGNFYKFHPLNEKDKFCLSLYYYFKNKT